MVLWALFTLSSTLPRRHRSGQSQNVKLFGLGDISGQNFDVKRKANESAWIVSLTFVSIISCAL